MKIGLKQLDEDGKVHFIELRERHVNFSFQDLSIYVNPYLQ